MQEKVIHFDDVLGGEVINRSAHKVVTFVSNYRGKPTENLFLLISNAGPFKDLPVCQSSSKDWAEFSIILLKSA